MSSCSVDVSGVGNPRFRQPGSEAARAGLSPGGARLGRAVRDPSGARSSRELSPSSTRSSRARRVAAEGRASTPTCGATRPPKRTHGTSRLRQWRSTAPGALPSSVVSSTVPSPVTAKAAPRARSSKPVSCEHDLGALASARRRAHASAAPSPPPAPAPGRSRYGASSSIAASRRSSSSTASGPAPFCGPKTRAAPRGPSSGLRTSQSTRSGTRSGQRGSVATQAGAAVDRRRAADADEHRRRPGHEHRERAARRARRVEATQRVALRLARAARARPPAPTRRPPSGPAASSQRAVTGRPSGSDAGASRHSPPSVRASTSAVPSPPSATGSSSHSQPSTRRTPSAERGRGLDRREDAFEASRTCERAQARASSACSTAASSSSASPARVRHPLERGVREPLAREEDEADADADRRLDRLQADPEREAARVGHAVLPQRQRDRRLDEADVPGPEREDRRDVHQHEHEAGGRRAARRCSNARIVAQTANELEQPAEVLVDRRGQRPAAARASRRARARASSSSMRTVPSSSSGSRLCALRADRRRT